MPGVLGLGSLTQARLAGGPLRTLWGPGKSLGLILGFQIYVYIYIHTSVYMEEGESERERETDHHTPPYLSLSIYT